MERGCLRTKSKGAGEMAQWFKSQAILPEDQILFPVPRYHLLKEASLKPSPPIATLLTHQLPTPPQTSYTPQSSWLPSTHLTHLQSSNGRAERNHLVYHLCLHYKVSPMSPEFVDYVSQPDLCNNAWLPREVNKAQSVDQ